MKFNNFPVASEDKNAKKKKTEILGMKNKIIEFKFY